MASFEIKRHDLRPFFVVILKDNFGESDEAVVNLSTATGVVFNMRAVQGGGTTNKIDRVAGTISNAIGGEVTYKWGSGDTDTSGTYNMECEVAWADGKPETFPGGPSGGSYWQVLITDDLG